jgi:uncharacterized protein (TIGR03083 family)
MTATDTIDRITVIRDEAQRFADVLATTAPEARCPTCPDWDAADLLWHLTEVHSFWAGILGSNARTDEDMEAVEAAKPDRPGSIADMLPVRARATEALLEQLTALDDAEPRWSWWEPDQTVGFTRRMQTYEATIHRDDAELTAGQAISPISPAVAAGAVDHCVDVMWGWMPVWASYERQAIVEFMASDTGQRWLVEVGHWFGTGPESGKEFDEPRAVRAGDDAVPVATVTGPVQDLALWAWTRGGTVDIAGGDQGVEAIRVLIANGIQ